MLLCKARLFVIWRTCMWITIIYFVGYLKKDSPWFSISYGMPNYLAYLFSIDGFGI